MGNGNMATGMEMPGYATTDLKGVQTIGAVKGGKNVTQTIISDFKKKLDSLAMAGQPVATAQTMVDMPIEDLSMATNTTAQAMPQGVVGILEGFGLLDYQTDAGAASAGTVQAADTAQTTTVNTPVADSSVGVQQAQASGQFARMLINEQQGAAADIPQQPDADAGKYSGSLESTNKQATTADAAVPVDGDEATVLQLKTKIASDTTPQAPIAAQAETQVREAAPLPQAPAVQPQAPTTDPAKATVNVQVQAPATDQTSAAEASRQQTTAVSESDAVVQAVTDEKVKNPQAAAEKTPPTTMTNAVADTAGAKAAGVHADTLSNASQTAETQEPASTFVKDNVIRIVDKVSTNAREGRYEFDVELKPDFLGKVSIKLTMQDGEIRMHVRTDDMAVKGMFSDQTSSLASALKEKGITISTVDVSYQDPMAAGREAFSQSGGGNSQKREGQIGWTADRYGGSELFDTTTPTAELLGGSSVEYLA